MKRIDFMKLMEQTVREELQKRYLLSERDISMASDPARKMREFILSKVNGNIIALANWTITEDYDSITEFFKKISVIANSKFENYSNPENFTDGEIKLLKVFEKRNGKKLNIEKDLASFELTPENSVSIFKKLYSDSKRLSYTAYAIELFGEKSVEQGTNNIAKSPAFPAEKKQSLRDLANVLKKVLQQTGEQK